MKVFIILVVCGFAAAQDNQAECVGRKLEQIFQTSLNETVKSCIADKQEYADLTKRFESLSEKASALRKTMETCGRDVSCLAQNFGCVLELYWQLIQTRTDIWHGLNQAANIDDKTKECLHLQLDEAVKKLHELTECWKKPEEPKEE